MEDMEAMFTSFKIHSSTENLIRKKAVRHGMFKFNYYIASHKFIDYAKFTKWALMSSKSLSATST